MGGSGPRDQASKGLTPPVVVLGCGFTGTRVVKLFLARGYRVYATSRNPANLEALRRIGATVRELDLAGSAVEPPLPPKSLLLHSVPDVADEAKQRLHYLIRALEPARVIYLSTTAVYGAQVEVDAHTLASPNDERGARRLAEEEFVRSGPWKSLILRPAGIYGPFRGVHRRVVEGRSLRNSGGIVSRIHVDDLAAITAEALRSDLGGAYPVADDCPCGSEDVARYARNILKMEGGTDTGGRGDLTISGRRVDGSAIRALLGIGLVFPNFEAGVLACLAEERVASERQPPSSPVRAG